MFAIKRLLLLLIISEKLFSQCGFARYIRSGRKRGGKDSEENFSDGNDKVEPPIADYEAYSAIPDQPEGGLFEGDIVPYYDTIEESYGRDVAEELVSEGLMEKKERKRSGKVGDAISSDYWRWNLRDPRDDRVMIPYTFAPSGFTSTQKSTVISASSKLAQASGYIKFVPRTTQMDYLNYTRGDRTSCSSSIGRNRGGQPITLGWCIEPRHTGSIIHEHLHALGFWHEQSRPDRDNFVTINKENIRTGKHNNFEKRTTARTFGSTYDFWSIMHYWKGAFAKESGLQTISTIPNGTYDNIIGQRNDVSTRDLEGLKLLYQCKSGARTRSQFLANPCTEDCKCAEKQSGCRIGGNDKSNVCMGSLVCAGNVCSVGRFYMYKNVGFTGMCLDINGGTANNFQEAQLSTCNRSRSQWWRYDSYGFIRSYTNDHKCLVPSGSADNGSKVIIYDCDFKYTYMRWNRNANGTFTLKNKPELCMDANTDFKVRVFLCNGNTDKVWQGSTA